MASRLPVPGQDRGTWAEILNDFLAQSLNDNGLLKTGSVTEAMLSATAQSKLNSIGSVQTVNGKSPTAGSVTLTASDVNAAPVSANWVTGMNYKAGQMVIYLGITYAALVDFTSTTSFNAADWLALGTSAFAPLTSVPQAYQDYIGTQMAGAPFEMAFQIDDALDFTNTTPANKYLPVVFDPSSFSSGAQIFFRSNLSQTAAGSGTVNVRLYNMTTGAVVASTTLTATVAQYNHSIQTSPDIRANLSTGPALYSVEVWAAAGYTGQTYKPSIVVRQTGVTNSQPIAQVVAYAGVISIDVSLGETVKVGTLTGDAVINAPTSAALGRSLTLMFYQDSTGGRVVSWNAIFRSPPPVDTTPQAVSVLSFVYDGTQWV